MAEGANSDIHYWQNTKHSILNFIKRSKNGEVQNLQMELRTVANVQIVYHEKILKVKCGPILKAKPQWKKTCDRLLVKFCNQFETRFLDLQDHQIVPAGHFKGTSETTYTDLKNCTLIITGRLKDVEEKCQLICKILGIEVENDTVEENKFTWNGVNKSCLLFVYLRERHFCDLEKEIKRIAYIEIEQDDNNGNINLHVTKNKSYKIPAGKTWKNETITAISCYFKQLSSELIDNLPEEEFYENKNMIEAITSEQGNTYVYWSKKTGKAIICGVTSDLVSMKNTILNEIAEPSYYDVPRNVPKLNTTKPKWLPKSRNRKQRKSSSGKDFIWKDLNKSLILYMKMKTEKLEELNTHMEAAIGAHIDIQQNDKQMSFLVMNAGNNSHDFEASATSLLKHFFKNYSAERILTTKDLFDLVIEHLDDPKSTSTYTYFSNPNNTLTICGVTEEVRERAKLVKEFIQEDEEIDLAEYSADVSACIVKYCSGFDLNVTFALHGSSINIKGKKAYVREAKSFVKSLVYATKLYNVFDAHTVLCNNKKNSLVTYEEKNNCKIEFTHFKPASKVNNQLTMPRKNATSPNRLLNGVTVNIIAGDLTQQKCDCIVRSSGHSFGFDSQVSKAILENGGVTIKSLCQQEQSSGQVINATILTTAGKLPCKNILHAAITNSIEESMTNILAGAKARDVKNLCMPLIGSGNYGSSITEAASSIQKGLASWLAANVWSLDLTIVLPKRIDLSTKESIKLIFQKYSKAGKTKLGSSVYDELDVFAREYDANGASVTYCAEDLAAITKTKSDVENLISASIKIGITKNITVYGLNNQSLTKIAEIGNKHNVHMRLSDEGNLETTGTLSNVSQAENELHVVLKQHKEENSLPENWEAMGKSKFKRINLDDNSEE